MKVNPEEFSVVGFLSDRFKFVKDITDVVDKAEAFQKTVADFRSKIDMLSRLFESGTEEKQSLALAPANAGPGFIYPNKSETEPVFLEDVMTMGFPPESKYIPEFEKYWNLILEANEKDAVTNDVNLSENYTIGHLSVNTSFPYVVVDNLGLRRLDILKNLCYLSNYIIEDLREIFNDFGVRGNKKMRINSGFRFQQNNSQHNIGQAVDVQFMRNNYVEDYFDPMVKEISNKLNFDQFIVEYSQGKYPTIWLHISYNKDLEYANQRNEILTYKSWNGLYSKGLTRV